jgi:hypothetical protein
LLNNPCIPAAFIALEAGGDPGLILMSKSPLPEMPEFSDIGLARWPQPEALFAAACGCHPLRRI